MRIVRDLGWMVGVGVGLPRSLVLLQPECTDDGQTTPAASMTIYGADTLRALRALIDETLEGAP